MAGFFFMPMSPDEIERRFTRLRTAMAVEGYDVLVVSGRSGAVESGYVRYVSGWRLWADAAYVVVPSTGSPALILRARSQAYWARQQSWLETVILSDDLGAAVVGWLRALPASSVGYVGLDTCAAAADVAVFRAAAPDGELRDATALVQDLMIHKSDEEKRLQRSTAQVLAEAHRRFTACLRPGMTEREAVGVAVGVVYAAGCIDGIAHISNQPPPFIRPPTRRRIEKDDVLRFSMEFAGPEGYWAELSGIYSFLPPSAEDQRLFNTTLRAFNRVGEMLRPGFIAGDLARAAEGVFLDAGYTDLGRAIWDAHGIGVNVIEPPLALADETAMLDDGMVINVHPGIVVGEEQRGIYLQDNFEVSAAGGIRQSGLNHRWNVV